MAAFTPSEEQRRRRRKRLLQGLALGGAAVGLPALANALVARRARDLEAPVWGRGHTYSWRLGEIAFRRLGRGEPLLLLHSFGPGHDMEEWRAAAERLAADHQVIAVDLLGWGRSAKPALAYDDEIYIQLIVDLLSEVVRERATLVAAGLPGAYAVQAAADHPELVRCVALSVPSGIELHSDEPDLKDAVVHRLLRLPVLGTSALNLYTSRAALERYLQNEVYANTEHVDAATIEHAYRASHQPGGGAALAAYLAGYLNHPVRESLARLKLPLWLGWGRQAVAPAVECADLWLQIAPQAELEIFNNAGILPHAERPARFVQGLLPFLERNAA